MSEFNSSKDSYNLTYTTHHNWRWVIQLAIEDLEKRKRNDVNFIVRHTERFSDLPSSSTYFPFLKPIYSLIRIDLEKENQEKKIMELKKIFRMSSLALSYMDAKDKLVRDLLQVQENNNSSSKDLEISVLSSCMPKTILLPWNHSFSTPDDLPSLPTYPSLLKAPLGSGGFGLYFVYNKVDVAEVIRGQKKRALQEEGFIEKLHKDPQYKDHPLSWSLQEYITPIEAIVPISINSDEEKKFHEDEKEKIINNKIYRRTQVRGYIIEMNGKLYLNKMLEVRCPLWSFDLEKKLEEEQILSDSFYPSRDSPCSQFNEKIKKIYTEDEDIEVDSLPFMPRTNHWEMEIEEECCGLGNARPYNVSRLKNKTLRYLFDELEYPSSVSPDTLLDKELLKETIYSALEDTFKLLRNNINNHYEENLEVNKKKFTELINKYNKKLNSDEKLINQDNYLKYLELENSLGVLGVDLLVYETNSQTNPIQVKIVEVNYNPAMAGEVKNMSEMYRNHLKEFVQSLMLLSIASPTSLAPNTDISSYDLPWSKEYSEYLLNNIRNIA